MYKPSDSHWHSDVQEALIVSSESDVHWHRETDVLVVGFGGAGATAAIEAVENGADVLAIDRFQGGGASNLSGGVYYAGGGTRYQKEVHYDDTPEEMFNYLKMETQGVVSDETLRRFCDNSVENVQWLERHGVGFEASLCPVKTSYPTDKYFLYYSGNEAVAEFKDVAKPAPRGHRAKANGLSGPGFYQPLKAAALREGVRFLPQSEVLRLVQDEQGRVLGVEVMEIPQHTPHAKKHALLYNGFVVFRTTMPFLASWCTKKMIELERSWPRRKQFIRARQGVVLSTGGFVFNRKMVKHHAPSYKKALPLGAPSCNGSGIRLGETAGAATDRMGRVSAWRFINPPLAWAQGIIVNALGERYCNEQVYGARLGRFMVEDNDGRAILIINKALYKQALQQIIPGKIWFFQTAPAMLNMFFNAKKADSIEGLAVKCGMLPERLKETLTTYNAAAKGEQSDPLRKSEEFLYDLSEGPYYAMDVSIDSLLFPCPTITVGGLVVDEASGLVKREDGSLIAGLYAAGRAAIGVASHEYVSGLSLADCVFSGRRAGAHAAICSGNQLTVANDNDGDQVSA